MDGRATINSHARFIIKTGGVNEMYKSPSSVIHIYERGAQAFRHGRARSRTAVVQRAVFAVGDRNVPLPPTWRTIFRHIGLSNRCCFLFRRPLGGVCYIFEAEQIRAPPTPRHSRYLHRPPRRFVNWIGGRLSREHPCRVP